MQYNNKIFIVFNTYDDFGQETESSKSELRCRILYRKKVAKEVDRSKTKKCDMKIVTGRKEFSPYNQLFDDDTILVEYDGLRYRPLVVTAINDFSGKAKYYEIELEQVK